MKRISYCLLWVFVAIIGLTNCLRDELVFTSDPNARLEFSVDTLRFDTVFTELGSATRLFKVYNRNNRAVRITQVSLESGNAARWRMNVDGIPGNQQTEVEILPKDSIYVFVEVTIDPDQPLSVSPFVIEDRIRFETNGNEQFVHLEAWGQNANYFPSRFNKGVAVTLSCNGGRIIWDDPKPYVIYGAVFVEACELVIPAGARVYVHGGVARNDLFGGVYNDGILYILESGKLTIQGTKDQPVILQGDRLEANFQNSAGQWNGLIIGRGSRGNMIEYATIRNSRFGVLVDSLGELTARNARFYNTSSSGIIGFKSRITAENCLVYNNGATSVLFLLGGDYDFTYCTIASYGVNASALGMSNFYCYNSDCSDFREHPLQARFRNSIIFGSRNDELELADSRSGQEPALFNINFENCVVRVQQLLTQSGGRYARFLEEQCNPCRNGSRTDRLFFDVSKTDFRLDSLSIAQGIAQPILFPRAIDIDIEGNLRSTASPDAGCYERLD